MAIQTGGAKLIGMLRHESGVMRCMAINARLEIDFIKIAGSNRSRFLISLVQGYARSK